MKNTLAMAALVALVSTPAILPTEAGARTHRHHTYQGRGGTYRHRCGGGNGAVGTIGGGVGGALIGNALGGGTLGTVAGGVGGALVGRHFDKKNTRHRNGC